MNEIYILGCCRTAIGSFGGSLKDTPAAKLGSIVIAEALKRSGITPDQVNEVMMGCTLTAAQGQNPARQAAIGAGIPVETPAYTVGMVCGSGMKAVIEAARAILADPRILILDEATASVDTITEQKIQAAIDTVIRGRTSVVIAHRLSTIRNADWILRVENGRIVEQGTHEQLMAARGGYRRLYTRQYEDEETLGALG